MTHPQKQQRSLIATLVLLVVFCPLAIDIYLPAFVVMAQEFAVTQDALQQSVAVFMLTVGLGQLITGPLADKIGRRPVALGGVIIYGCAAFAASMARSFEWLIIARAIQGIGACATFVCAFAIVRDVFGAKKSGQVLTYLNGVVCFIPALAPILGAWLTVQFNWQSNFIFMALWSLIGVLALMFMYKETRPQSHIDNSHLLDLRRFWPVLRTPVFFFHSTLAMVVMSAILMFVTRAPGWIMDELGFDINTFTFWFTLNGGLSILASFIAPQLIKRSARLALQLGLVILLINAGVLLLFSNTYTVMAFMLPLLFCALGYALTLGSAAGAALAPFAHKAGTASALIGVMQMSGAGLLVLLTQHLNLNAPQLVALHLFALLPFFLILLKPSTKRWY